MNNNEQFRFHEWLAKAGDVLQLGWRWLIMPFLAIILVLFFMVMDPLAGSVVLGQKLRATVTVFWFFELGPHQLAWFISTMLSGAKLWLWFEVLKQNGKRNPVLLAVCLTLTAVNMLFNLPFAYYLMTMTLPEVVSPFYGLLSPQPGMGELLLGFIVMAITCADVWALYKLINILRDPPKDSIFGAHMNKLAQVFQAVVWCFQGFLTVVMIIGFMLMDPAAGSVFFGQTIHASTELFGFIITPQDIGQFFSLGLSAFKLFAWYMLLSHMQNETNRKKNIAFFLFVLGGAVINTICNLPFVSFVMHGSVQSGGLFGIISPNADLIEIGLALVVTLVTTMDVYIVKVALETLQGLAKKP